MATRVLITAVVVLATLPVAAAAYACSYSQGASLLPEPSPPSELPPDVAFTYSVFESPEDPIQIELLDDDGENVSIEIENVNSSHASAFRIVRPIDALAAGAYFLRATPDRHKPGATAALDFEVTDEAEHAEFPDVAVDLSSERTNSPAPCDNGGVWRSHVQIQADEDLPAVALFLNKYEMRDGETFTIGSVPRPMGGARDVVLTEPYSAEVECVTPTVVLASGAQIPLPRTCETGGGGCSTAGQTVHASGWLIGVLLVLLRRRSR